MTTERIVVVEDDADILRLIQITLENQGYEVWAADDGMKGLKLFRQVKPDLAVLDVLLPGMNGLELCGELRKASDCPVIFLSARRDAEDIISGLDQGADDYITKPFDPSVLAARVRARLRRSVSDSVRIEELGGLAIDWPGRDVLRNGEPVPLFTKERQLLFFLLENPNQVFSSSQLYTQIWGGDFGSDEQTVKVHISNLRKKIEEDPANPKYILTVRGFGYKLAVT